MTLRSRSPITAVRWGLYLGLLLGVGLGNGPARAQTPLRFVDDETTVREVSFRFVGSQTFEPRRLHEHIATKAPGVFTGIRNRLAFLPGLRRRAYPFDPLTLQKDVVRLRQFYQQNGFLEPQIDYPASQLDTSDNEIHVIFSIQEGTPLRIRDMAFQTSDGSQPVTSVFSNRRTRRWRRFRKRLDVDIGERYTEFKQTQLREDVQTWLRNQGFAFARTTAEARIDSTKKETSLRFLIDPGPLARVGQVVVEGNESVSKTVVRRELPFSIGDRFSADAVTAGQRALFDLNLFRVALADIPDQPRDSTVMVRYRVRETKLRSYTGQIGYGTEAGISLQGNWRHRNFYGDARALTVGLIADTGFPRNPSRVFPFFSDDPTKNPNRLFRASVALRQPYVFTERLAATVEPFVQERRNPALSPTPDRELQLLERLRLNERQFGVTTTLIYDFLPFRSLSLQHSFSRTEQFRGSEDRDVLGAGRDDQFDRSVFALSGTFGDADDFINPTKGYIVRPTFEVGGIPFQSGVDFTRIGGEISGYLPAGDQIELAGRLFGGILSPLAESRTNLTIPRSAPDSLLRRNRRFQDRFSDLLFYAGGGSDVRGWAPQLAGGKVLRDLASDTTTSVYAYRPIGARTKLGVNLEVRLPFPGLGEQWRSAFFVDAAYLETDPLNLVPPTNVAGVVSGRSGKPVATAPNRVMVGTGTGLRYRTPFGFLRLDLAYKLTPDRLDLRRPGEVGRAVQDGAPTRSVETRRIRQFRLHFGIGRSF